MSARAQSKGKGFIRVRILLFVVVNIVTVEYKRCVFGDVHPIVNKILSSVDVTKDGLIPISSEGTTRGGVRVVGRFNRLDGTAEYESRQESVTSQSRP